MSVQLDKSGGGTSLCSFWGRVDGTDIPNSCSEVSVAGTNGEVLANVPFLLNLTAGQTFSVVFASPDSTMAATAHIAQASPFVRPAVPSIITRIQRVG